MIAMTTADERLHECAATDCPMCGKEWEGVIEYEGDECLGSVDASEATERAAHCCLWKVVGHPVRVRIAGRVNSGATWLEALRAEGVTA